MAKKGRITAWRLRSFKLLYSIPPSLNATSRSSLLSLPTRRNARVGNDKGKGLKTSPRVLSTIVGTHDQSLGLPQVRQQS